MTYDVTDHPLLGDEAKELDQDVLEAHGRIAEQVLGLAGSELGGDEAEAAKDAIVLQINYQLENLPDRDYGALIAETPFRWLDDPEIVAINPLALRMAARLVGTGRRVPAASVRVPEAEDVFAVEIT